MTRVAVPRPGRRALRGRSLVELMVALTVSAIVVAGVGVAYLGSSQTARVASQLAAAGNDGQMTLQWLGNAIKQAGYAELVGAEIALGGAGTTSVREQSLFGDGVTIFGCTSAGFVDDTHPNPTCAEAGDRNFDALMVRFQSEPAIPPTDFAVPDCVGAAAPPQPLPADHPGRTRIASGERPIVQNAYFGRAGALWCRGNGRAAATDAFMPAQELLSNVEQFKVFYGFDDARWANPTAALSPSTRSLRDARFLQDLPANTRPWDFVVSVHVCMVVRADPDIQRRASARTEQRYTRCPMSADEAASGPIVQTATDGVIRRTQTQVFTVRAAAASNPLEFMP